MPVAFPMGVLGPEEHCFPNGSPLWKHCVMSWEESSTCLKEEQAQQEEQERHLGTLDWRTLDWRWSCSSNWCRLKSACFSPEEKLMQGPLLSWAVMTTVVVVNSMFWLPKTFTKMWKLYILWIFSWLSDICVQIGYFSVIQSFTFVFWEKLYYYNILPLNHKCKFRLYSKVVKTLSPFLGFVI